MKLSVLDQSTAAKGRGQDDAIRETLALARHCDALGYHRYWLSEHHNSDSIAATVVVLLPVALRRAPDVTADTPNATRHEVVEPIAG